MRTTKHIVSALLALMLMMPTAPAQQQPGNDNALPPSASGGSPSSSPLNIATVTLTGAQLAAINTVPVTVIAAQVGKYPNLSVAGIGIPAQFTAGTTPYTVFGTLFLTAYLGDNSGLAVTSTSEGNVTGSVGSDVVVPLEFVPINSPGTASQFSNLPIILQASASSSGRVTAINITGLRGGSAYAPGDTGHLNDGDSTANYIVGTVDENGRVLTTTVLGGTGYGDPKGVASTAIDTGAGDGQLRIIYQSAAGVITSGVVEPYGGFAYAPGDTTFPDSGGGHPVITIDTVDANGSILTMTITSKGVDQTLGVKPQDSTSGVGVDVLINFTAIQSVADGDGTLTLTVPYIVVTLQ